MLLLPSAKENSPKMDQLESIDFLKLIGPLPEQVLFIDCSQETGVFGFLKFQLELINSKLKWFLPLEGSESRYLLAFLIFDKAHFF